MEQARPRYFIGKDVEAKQDDLPLLARTSQQRRNPLVVVDYKGFTERAPSFASGLTITIGRFRVAISSFTLLIRLAKPGNSSSERINQGDDIGRGRVPPDYSSLRQPGNRIVRPLVSFRIYPVNVLNNHTVNARSRSNFIRTFCSK